MAYQFYDDPDFNFGVLVALGGVHAGAGDAGEIMTVVSAVKSPDDQQWAASFEALAARIGKIADEAKSAGNRASARSAFLRAATYYAAALESQSSFADEPTLLATFRKHRRCWDEFAVLNEPAFEKVEIPYEGTHLPGFFLSVDGTPRPTMVFINGSDGSLTWLWPEVQAAYERGYNSIVFDGPGQQSMLFEHQMPFRPDWEAVVTPVVDFILKHADVDPSALVLWGGSQGGYWAPRSLAFEKRFAAGIADPGVVDVSKSWLAHFPTPLIQLVTDGDSADFNAAMTEALKSPQLASVWNFRARPYEQPTPYDTIKAMQAYALTDVAKDITTPLMICSPEGEQFWPGQSEQLAGLVSGPVNLVQFTAAEGADLHCEPMARALVHQRMFDWLATIIGERS